MNTFDLMIVFILISVVVAYFYGKNKQKHITQKHMENLSNQYGEYLNKSSENEIIFNDNKKKLEELESKINEIHILRKKRSEELIDSLKQGNVKEPFSNILESDSVLLKLEQEEKDLFKVYEEYIENNHLKIKKYSNI